ncbi:MAG: hypothetical protein Q7Q71_00345 [Verrucomicrobiota bacterium JB023]|nr:hypothetical protein [Verrucomicrobiota bacterium JB023]
MNAKSIQVTALALIAALMASCAPAPNQGYYANGYPARQQGANPNDVAMLAAVGIAGLATYGYFKERGDRKDAQKKLDRYEDRRRHRSRGHDHYDSYRVNDRYRRR